MDNQTIRNEYSRFLGSAFQYSHFITVKAIHEHPFSRNQIEKRLRTINFAINKHFLKSSWSRWKQGQRFWMVVVEEETKGKHFHALLHSPRVIHKNKLEYEYLPAFIKMRWNSLPLLVEQRQTKTGEHPLHIEPVRDSGKAAGYIAKTLHNPERMNEGWFFI
jgi:hypothetical protein